MAKSIMKARPRDPNQIAYRLVQMATEEPATPEEKKAYAKELARELTADLKGEELPKIHRANPDISAYMAAIGSKGGKVGGKRRLKTMTAEERKKSAQKAAKARWKKK